MTTTTRRHHRANVRAVIQADQQPRIADLVPDTVIYRFATIGNRVLVAELPCHRDQMVSVEFDQRTSPAIKVDQPVVCRRCFTAYAATPVPGDNNYAFYRVVYLHTGRIAISRPKQHGE